MLSSEVEFIRERAKKESFNVFHHANTVIIVSGKNGNSSSVDLASATQNILLSEKTKDRRVYKNIGDSRGI